MQIHRVIHARYLRKAADDPLLGQAIELPEPLVIARENEWEVEELLAVRSRYGKLVYRVKWEGADEDPEEYPAGNFKYYLYKVKDFYLANPTHLRPPTKLLE